MMNSLQTFIDVETQRFNIFPHMVSSRVFVQYYPFEVFVKLSFGSLKQACWRVRLTLGFTHSRVPVWYVLSFWAVSLLAFNWFLGICRLRLCRLILLQQSCCDIGDKVFNRNSSGQLTQNKSTIYLFNSLCKLVELVEQQSCCQKLLKNKPLSKEKEQSLGPLVKKQSELHKPLTQLSKKISCLSNL